MKEIYASSWNATADFVAKLGAEARIDLFDWQGRIVIRKARITKGYRDPDLDQLLRTKRTRQEVEILLRAKLAGVMCPTVFFADPGRAEIYMQYLPGDTLKHLESVASAPTSRQKKEKMTKLEKVYGSLGTYAARLHEAKIIHGDLTTKNVIVSDDGVYLLDFGLSFISDRVEDRAEDLHLLNQALRSAGTSRWAKSVFEIVLKAYEAGCSRDKSERVLNQLHDIELRGRYARVD